jgi:ABC-type multidrug transport system fused ATPase/permease subunit
MRDTFFFLKPYRGKFFLATIFRILSEVAGLYPAFALAAIANFFASYSIGESLTDFWRIVQILVFANIAYFGLAFVANYYGYRIAKRASIDAELKALDHAFKLDMEWHEKENTGNKVKRIGRGADAMNHLIRTWFNTFIEMGVTLIGVMAIFTSFDRTITLATIAFMLVYFLVSTYFTRKAIKVQKIEHVKEEEMSGLLFEAINNVRSAKVMSMTRHLFSKLSGMARDYYDLADRRIFLYQSGGLYKSLFAHGFRVVVISYIGYGIMQGNYEIGFMVLFYSYFSRVLQVVSRLAETSQEFITRKQSIGRMAEILGVKPVTDIEEGKHAFPSDWKKIDFQNVSFAYGDKKVLDGISFSIKRGEKIGVIGLSGAGKSTLFKLLLKERENYTGEIMVDERPLRSISKSDYFNHAAVVLQDTEVFNFSLKENIVISNMKQVENSGLLEKALDVAHVKDFAKALPQGIDTLIGEKGVKLSGGEKQRVGLARAVFKDPQLLLLDEATSHLDVESEEKIQDSLHKFFQTVTAIVIAHRLTTIKQMDKILVLENGQIMEQGSFDELYAKRGRFFELWEKQKL